MGTHLGFCGSAVLVCAADVDAVEAPAATVARVHISTQHTPNDITQVRHIVDIWEGTCDQNVPLACLTYHNNDGEYNTF